MPHLLNVTNKLYLHLLLKLNSMSRTWESKSVETDYLGRAVFGAVKTVSRNNIHGVANAGIINGPFVIMNF